MMRVILLEPVMSGLHQHLNQLNEMNGLRHPQIEGIYEI